MRDCIFLLADSMMEAVFRGFLNREKCHLSLRCKAFDFDPREDIIRGISDPNTSRQAHVLLRDYHRTHRYAVVVLDNDWDGSPGVERIRSDVAALLSANGWGQDHFEVLVINPELENWIWQESEQINRAFNYKETISMRQWLRKRDMWKDGEAKPARPKEAAKAVLKMTRVPQSGATYQRVVERVSVSGCTDPAFMQLCEALRRWFPAGERY